MEWTLSRWTPSQQSFWLAFTVLAVPGFALPSLAQLVPDTTLAEQSSIVGTSGMTDTIEGGARSGISLFHSFREFNVGAGRSVYFSDPGVSNILTRVTGANSSSINGRLGVQGNANLFLINPNGVIFGPGASLDIRGSFTATTVAVRFSDGSVFSADNPTAPALLTIAVPVGLQRGGNSSVAMIVNRGSLQTGRDLTLAADRLDLQGSLQAGRDLTLLATETVRVRDMLTQPFLAQSGGNLTVQGDRGIDILALHPTAAFQSGGNLSLISDGVISGDARFASRGNFQVRSVSGGLATFRSLYDPIITSAGDVDLALDYSGASLLIEAGGNIRIQGTVDITTPDAAAAFVGDDAVLNSQPGLILRSGQVALRYSTSDVVPGSNNAPGLVATPGITLQGAVTIAPDGIVNLTADGNGSISTQAITTPRGMIALTSQNSIATNGQTLNVGTDSGDGGSIRLSAPNGISTGDLIASSDASSVSTTVTTLLPYIYTGSTYTNANGITYIDGQTYFFTYTEDIPGNAGNGGTIVLSSPNGNVTTGDVAVGSLSFGNTGNGGTLSISSPNGNVTTGDVAAGSLSFGNTGNGGTLSISSINGSILTGTINTEASGQDGAKSGGRVTIATTNGDIAIGDLKSGQYAFFNITGQAGIVTLSSSNGNISTGYVDLTSGSAGFSLRGGDLTISTINGSITTTGTLDVSSLGGGGNGDAGKIVLSTTNGNITTQDLFAEASSSFSLKFGNGGTIAVSSSNGSVTTGKLNAFSLSDSFDTGNAGSITVVAADNLHTGTVSNYALSLASRITVLPPDFDRSIPLVKTGKGGAITLTSTRGSIETSDLFSFSTAAPAPDFFFGPPENLEPVRQAVRIAGHDLGGDIRLSAAQNITTGVISTISSDGSGAIALSAGNTINATGTIISSDTFGVGKAGDITLSAPSVWLADGAQLSAATHGTGAGGNITIAASQLELSGTSSLPPTTTLVIQTPIGLTVIPDVYLGGYLPTGDVGNIPTNGAFPSGIFVQNTQGSTGNAGNIAIQAGQLTLRDQGTIAATTFGSGAGGNVTINAGSILADNGSIFSGVAPGADGNSGAIALITQSLNLTNQGRVQALTLGTGKAGDIQVQADAVTIAGEFSGIISGSGNPDQRGGSIGNGGNIRLNANRLQISNSGILSASTFTEGQGGTIEVAANTVDLTSQGKLSATTQDQGQAGNITVNARDRVTISDSGSGLFANTTSQSSGNGGSIFLTTSALRLQNQGRITVDSQGSGSGGDIQLSVNRLDLDDRGTILAETASAQGGNIQIQARDFTLLRHSSLISATAGTAAAGGNGGNITIATPNGFVVGVLAENSDITANAFTGNGGQVNITAQGIFGLKFQSQLTPNSDITASSQFGVNGTVTLNTLNVDPSRSLIQLPSSFSDANQVAQTCSAQQRQNSFIVTGRGGLSPDPTEAVTQTQLWTEGAPSRSLQTQPPPETPKAIVEATGLQKNLDGSTSLVAEGETVASLIAQANCPIAPQER